MHDLHLNLKYLRKRFTHKKWRAIKFALEIGLLVGCLLIGLQLLPQTTRLEQKAAKNSCNKKNRDDCSGCFDNTYECKWNTKQNQCKKYQNIPLCGGQGQTVNPSEPGAVSFPNTRKVLVLEFNPIIKNRDNKRLNAVFEWNEPKVLEPQYIQDITETSAGFLNYQIVERQMLDVYPVKADGFQYTDETYLNCWETHYTCWINGGENCDSKCHDPDIIDYRKMLADYQVCEKRNSGEIDELWLWGAPWFGYAEANMAGPGAYDTNGSVIMDTACEKPLHIMGFNYERGVPEMLEDFGHRVEGTMANAVFYSWTLCGPTDWDKFASVEVDCPGQAVCGTIHYPPNGEKDYDWSNKQRVNSSCESWKHYPNVGSNKDLINCSAWNPTPDCGDDSSRYFIKWWLEHLPRNRGVDKTEYGDFLNNWWPYIIDLPAARELLESERNYQPTLPQNTQCSAQTPLTARLCREKKIYQWLPRALVQCVPTANISPIDNLPICEYKDKAQTCIPENQKKDGKCLNQVPGKQFGSKSCVSTGKRNAQDRWICQLR